ncbi:MAG: fibronectin type III domain-containing protein [Candidatus Shapirobacteria bacterium]|jgi:hypothetical protein
MKTKLIFLVSSILLLVSSFPALAGNNITITCSSADTCTNSSSLPIFDETNIAPGYIVSPAPILTVINQRQNDECNLTFSAGNLAGSSDLLSKISLSITSLGNVDYAGNISSLLDGESRSLGIIPPSSDRQYVWTTSFDQDAGNDLKNTSAKFDLDFNFSCDLPPTPTPTPIATSTPVPTSKIQDPGSNNSGSVLGVASAPSCNDTAPKGAPILSGIIAGVNSATLTWLPAPAPVSYYLIAYGTSPGKYLYGNPNVGGPGTTSYTVTNLSANTTYYFVVRAGNGCAPGPFSAELSSTPGGVVLPASQIPPGFQPGVLGETTEPTPTITPPTGEVIGVNTSCQQNIIPFIISLIIFIISSFLYFKLRLKLVLSILIISIILSIVFFPNCLWYFYISNFKLIKN